MFCRIAIDLTGGGGAAPPPPEPICVAAMDVADFTYTGSAKVDDSDGSVMSITQTANSQQGTGMLPVTVTADDNLAVTFQMLTGGGSGADGMCMNLGGNSLGGRYGEDGVSVGLAVCFDEWSNGNHEHGVMMFWNGGSAGDTHSGAGTGGVIWSAYGDCGNRVACTPISLFEDNRWHEVAVNILTNGDGGATASFTLDTGEIRPAICIY